MSSHIHVKPVRDPGAWLATLADEAWAHDARAALATRPDCAVFEASVDGKPVGFAAFFVMGDGHLHFISVHESFRRRRVAATLFARVVGSVDRLLPRGNPLVITANDATPNGAALLHGLDFTLGSDGFWEYAAERNQA